MILGVLGTFLSGLWPGFCRAQNNSGNETQSTQSIAASAAATGNSQGQDPQQVLAAQQIDAFTETGRQRMAAGDAHGALEQFNAALRLAPNDAALLNNAAAAQAAAGNLPSALELLHRALDTDPQRGDIRANLMRLQAWMAHHALPADPSALEQADPALPSDPADQP